MKARSRRWRFPLISIAALTLASSALGLCQPPGSVADSPPPSTLSFGTQNAPASKAYKGHENDSDIGNFVKAFPAAAGTRLDDCQTCHRAGISGTGTAREFSPCGYCHLLQYANPR